MMNVNTDAVASEKALRKRKITNAIVMILLIIVLFIFIFPFLMVIINVFKQKSDIMRDPLALIGSKGFTLENFPNAMAKMGFWGAFWMMCGDVGSEDGTAVSGAEVDIIETGECARKGVNHAIHWDGYGRAAVRGDDRIHGHSVPGPHGSARLSLRRHIRGPESQDHPDPYAYGLRNVHGGLYVPRGYPYKYPD